MSNSQNIDNNQSTNQSAEASSAHESAAKRPTTVWGKVVDKLMNGKGIFTFLRSSVSSQIASWIDMGSSITLVACGVSKWLATPVGAVLGGIVNCCINYKFTFQAKNCSVKAVALKYIMIWLGSVTLNTVGTSVLATVLDRWHLLETIGFTSVGSYAAARLIVSLLVSWFWNFLLQKNFVYVPSKFDPYAIKVVDFVTFKKQTKS